MKKFKQLAAYSGFINWNSLKLLWKNRSAFHNYLQKNKVLFWEENSNTIPKKDFYELFTIESMGRITVELVAEPCTGGTTIQELFFLSLMVRIIKPKIIFEIGTFDGASSVHFALNSVDSEAKIYTIDLPIVNELQFPEIEWDFLKERKPGYFIKHYETTAVHELFGNSIDFDFSPFYGQVDLMFIDGNHNAEYIRHDTAEALKMVKPGGVIVWHDYFGIPGEDVSVFLEKFAQNYAVYRIRKTCLAVLKKSQ